MVIPIKVYCYAGYRGEQEPRVFEMGGHKIEVVSILDRWLCPEHRYFKVVDKEACRYIMRHDEHTQQWELVYYRHPDSPENG